MINRQKIRGQTVRKLKLNSDKTQYAVENRNEEHQILPALKKKAEFSDSLGGYYVTLDFPKTGPPNLLDEPKAVVAGIVRQKGESYV